VLGVRLDRGDLPELAELAAACSDLAPSSAHGSGPRATVLLDTETTGLDTGGPGGAGDRGPAVPFVVGLAIHVGAVLRVDQYTLNSLAGERAMLGAVLARLDEAASAGAQLMTYNGASFDLPLLRRRVARLGLDAKAGGLRTLGDRHIDLLHPARRLWRDRFEDCRLTTLERQVLGVVRRDDIAGHEIPAVFWDALRRPEDPCAQRKLALVRAHNELDLLSLPRLAVAARRLLETPVDRGDARLAIDTALRVAAHFEKVGNEGRAVARLGAMLDATAGSADARRVEASLRCARLLRRGGSLRAALVRLYVACDEFPGEPSLHDALAKELEHRQRDPAAALAVLDRSRRPCPRRRARLVDKLAAYRPGVHVGAGTRANVPPT